MSLKGRGKLACLYGLEKSKCHYYFNKRKEEELGNYKSHFCHGGGDKTNNPGNHCQAYEEQEDD